MEKIRVITYNALLVMYLIGLVWYSYFYRGFITRLSLETNEINSIFIVITFCIGLIVVSALYQKLCHKIFIRTSNGKPSNKTKN